MRRNVAEFACAFTSLAQKSNSHNPTNNVGHRIVDLEKPSLFVLI
jgi:hypothetical protein